MKKLFILLAILATFILIGCSQPIKQENSDVDSTITVPTYDYDSLIDTTKIS